MIGRVLRRVLGWDERTCVRECCHCGRSVDEETEVCPECGREAIAHYDLR